MEKGRLGPWSSAGSIWEVSISGTSFSFPSLLHRARTALRAISFRSSGVKVLARALPPLEAPSADMAFAPSLAVVGNSSSVIGETILAWAGSVKYKVEQVFY